MPWCTLCCERCLAPRTPHHVMCWSYQTRTSGILRLGVSSPQVMLSDGLRANVVHASPVSAPELYLASADHISRTSCTAPDSGRRLRTVVLHAPTASWTHAKAGGFAGFQQNILRGSLLT